MRCGDEPFQESRTPEGGAGSGETLRALNGALHCGSVGLSAQMGLLDGGKNTVCLAVSEPLLDGAPGILSATTTTTTPPCHTQLAKSCSLTVD